MSGSRDRIFGDSVPRGEVAGQKIKISPGTSRGSHNDPLVHGSVVMFRHLLDVRLQVFEVGPRERNVHLDDELFGSFGQVDAVNLVDVMLVSREN